jgi:hypothetical protein
LQAVTPRGVENEGLPDRQGPTVITPALALFHALDDGTALQAFVGTNVPLLNRMTQPVRRDVQYGVALQRPLSTESNDPLRRFHVSLGALGQVGRNDGERKPSWDLLPGLHWRPASSWSISGGLMLPVGAVKSEPPQRWQVTASWQF